jgi:type IV secretory pathway VirB2 component (pilin)
LLQAAVYAAADQALIFWRFIMKAVSTVLASRNVKRIIAVLAVMFLCVGALSAQEDAIGLQQHVNTILDIITSNAVRGIACIFLIILCIGLITTGRQEPEMFKKFIPWIAGTILFMAAGTITDKFLDQDNLSDIKSTFNN